MVHLGAGKVLLTSDYSVKSSGTAGFLTQSPWFSHRKALSVCSSVAAHILLLVSLTCFRNTPLPIKNESGHAGNEISIVNLNLAMLPVFEPLPSLPEPEVTLPKTVVIKKAEIVVEREKPATKHPPVKKAITTDNQPVRLRPVVKPVLQPVTTDMRRQVEPSQQKALSESMTAAVASASGGDAAPGGESTSGHAAKGAGNETTSRVRVLNRRVNYPARARSMGVEGRVKVQFDISAFGTIKNIQILAEDPAGVFSGDLRRDITRWRYDITGEVKNQIVTVIYKLDGRIQVIN